MKRHCIVCGEESEKPVRAALSHFRLYEHGMWQYLAGNMSLFGKFSGFLATCYLAFPWLNTIRFWKERRAHLNLDVGGVPVALESLFDENGCAKK